MKEQRILFSPIGGTDPISNFRDGSMLHICRIYKPNIVFLYMSKEIVEYHRDNDRYRYCLKKLSELTGQEFDIRIIERPDLVNVQKYDFFYKEFEEIIRDIHSNFEGDILLNTSSGTPAMKNALNLLSELMNIKLYPIQVATPEKSINPHEEDNNDYDVETYWELNKDNDDLVDRSELVENVNQTALLVSSSIKELIDAYDYSAALRIAKDIREFLPEETFDLLQIAEARSSLDKSSFTKCGGDKYNLIPVKDSNLRDIIEYILLLQIKANKGEYADFLRAITPVFYEICKYVVEKKCYISLSNLTYRKSNTGALVWKSDLQIANPEIYDFFIRNYENYRGGFVASEHLTRLIYEYDSSVDRKRAFDKFRAIEESVRNIAAHNLIAITDEWIKAKCGYDSRAIIKMLKELVKVSEINISRDDWNSYEKMNEFIKSTIKLR